MNIFDGGFSWGTGGYHDGPVNPEHMQGSGWKTKNAWDLEVRPGTEVHSITEGIVVAIKSPSTQNSHLFGASIEVSGRGKYSTVDIFYSNLSSVSVKVGDKVGLGEKLGKVAKPSSGNQPFLHVGLSFGNSIDSLIDSSGNIPSDSSTTATSSGGNGKKEPELSKSDDSLLGSVYGGLAKGLLPLAAFGGIAEEVNRIKKLMK